MEHLLKKIINNIHDDAKIKQVCIGLFGAIVESRTVGFSYMYPKTNWKKHHGVENAGNFIGKSAKKLCECVYSENPTEKSLGVAAINSLIEADGTVMRGRPMLKKRASGKKVAVIGHFPFIDEFREVASELWCFELDPRPGDLIASKEKDYLPQADVVIVTGSTFPGYSALEILQMAKGREIHFLGPTTIMSNVLFEFGASTLCGVKIIDKEKSFLHVMQGGTFRKLAGTEQVIMTSSQFECILNTE